MRIGLSIAVVFAASAAACISPDRLPVQAGGGGEAVSGGAMPGAGSGTNAVVSGRVCVLLDPRVTTACSPLGVAGLVVTLGQAATLTAADGSFALPATASVPSVPPQMVTVTGASVVPSSLAVTSSTVVVPVMPAAMFRQVLADENVEIPADAGTIIATVEDATGIPVSGVSAASLPPAAFGPFFDGATPLGFTSTLTGPFGESLFPGVPAGAADLGFTPTGTTLDTTVNGVQVIANGVTFATATMR